MSHRPAISLLISFVALSGLPAQADHTTYFNFDSPVTKLAQYEFTPGQTLGVVSGTWVDERRHLQQHVDGNRDCHDRFL